MEERSSARDPFTRLGPPWHVCLEEAWAAYAADSIPIGAAYTAEDGTVLLQGRNRLAEAAAPQPFLSGSRVAHAEMNVLVQMPVESYAAAAKGRLYTTLEPCPMCFGAALMCGVREIRYGARDRWAGAGNLRQASPYVASKNVRVVGPEPFVQAVSLVLMTEHTLRRGPRRAEEIVAAFAEEDAAAVALGREWLRTGYLQRSARAEVPIAVVCLEVWRRIGAGHLA